MPPGTPPRGPAPDVGVIGEVIAGRVARCGLRIGRPADRHDARDIAEAIEKLAAEAKEIGRRQAVVLQNDPLLLMRKEPIDGGADADAAAKVRAAELRLDLAGPV